MEDEKGIGLILARATELRLKLSDCIDDASSASTSDGEVHCVNPGGGRDGLSLGNVDKSSHSGSGGEAEDDEDEDEEAERLLHIRDALESLESQLAALQNLGQRQQYEKQLALSEIDCSRKMLLQQLKGYKGKDLDVIRETSAFAGERVDHENDLLLPPYPIHPPPVSDNAYPPHLTPKQRIHGNRLASSNAKDKEKSDSPYREPESSSSSNRVVLRVVGSVAKIALPIIGLVSLLSASGYGPEMRKRGKLEKGSSGRCPPGKVLAMEERCVVRESVDWGYG